MRITLTAFVIAFFFSLSSCLHDKFDDIHVSCDSTFFVDSIKPIFLLKCYDPDNNGACHNTAAASIRGNYSVYAAAQDGIQSRLEDMQYRINLPASDVDHMPQTGTLSSTELQTLNKWLEAGGKYCK
jgi:hypothetical protein